nr:uncharacterized mitochondrial protein AtMg00810-like [Tanacetum cinerariifolium]
GTISRKGLIIMKLFAPVARLKAIRIFLAYAACMGFVFQMDVKSGFLNEKISEEVYQANPKEFHLVAVKRIFMYLKETPNLGLWYLKGSGFNLKEYSDSDYAGCNLDRKSTSGGCQILVEKLVCWNAKKQSLVVMSPAQADCVSTALTKQPSAYYSKYLREFWYTAEVESATNTITFTLSNFDKPISFNLAEFSSVIGLNYTEDFSPLPQKEMVRATLATLGLVDENNPKISSTDLVNTSPLKIRYFSATLKVLMLYIIKCLGGNRGSHDQLNINQQMIAYGLCWGFDIDIAGILFSDLITKLTTRKKGIDQNICYTRYLSLIIEHLLREACNNKNLKSMKTYHITASTFKSLTASEEVNTNTTADKSLESSSSTQVDDTQHAEELVTAIDATQSLDASKSVDEQGNQPKTTDAKKVQENFVDEVVHVFKKKEDDDELTDSGIRSLGNVTFEELYGNAEESPYDTESEIKEVDFDLDLMPKDKLESVFEFEEAESDDDENDKVESKVVLSKSEEATADNIPDELVDMSAHENDDLNAFVDKLSLWLTKYKDSMPRLFADAFEERVPELLSDTLKNILPQIIKDSVKQALPKFDKIVKKTLNAEILELLIKPRNNAFNLLNKKERNRRKCSEEKSIEDEPPFKKLRFLVPNLNISSPTPLKSLMPQGMIPLVVIDIPLDQFTDSLFNTSSSEFSPAPPSKIANKGKIIATKDDPTKQLMPFIEQSGSSLKIPNLNQFSTSEGQMTIEEAKAQMQEIQRLALLKAEKKKSKKRADPLPIIKISYKINNSTKEASMRIKRNNQPLSLTVYDKFVLKMLGFIEWIEVHALASKIKRKSNDILLKNLKAKFQWVKTQAAKLGIPPPPRLTAFELPLAGRKVGMKRKRRSELIHEVFVKENIIVDGMQRNLTLPEGVVGKASMVVKEPEAGIFLYNGNFDLLF